MEAIFEQIAGVSIVTSGYAGGALQQPKYRDVCSGKTGHAEVVQIKYNPELISYEELLEVFFAMHDPTTINQQGVDKGSQYRSVIVAHNEAQKEAAQNFIASLVEGQVFQKPLQTEILSGATFYEAEYYHQNYYSIHCEQPYGRVIIAPKLSKLHELYPNIVKSIHKPQLHLAS